MLTCWFAGAAPSGVARARPARTDGTMCIPESATADAGGAGAVAVTASTTEGTTKRLPVMSPMARLQRLRMEPEAEPPTERRLLTRLRTGRDGTFILLRGTLKHGACWRCPKNEQPFPTLRTIPPGHTPETMNARCDIAPLGWAAGYSGLRVTARSCASTRPVLPG